MKDKQLLDLISSHGDSSYSPEDLLDEEHFKGALKITKIKNRRYIRMPNFPKRSVVILRDWLNSRLDNPYPTHKEKDLLSKESELSKRQIQNWFTNARKVSPRIYEFYRGFGSRWLKEIKKTRVKSNQLLALALASLTTSKVLQRLVKPSKKKLLYRKKPNLFLVFRHQTHKLRNHKTYYYLKLSLSAAAYKCQNLLCSLVCQTS